MRHAWVATLILVPLSMGTAVALAGWWSVAVGSCALVATPLLWWLMVDRYDRPGIARGAGAGALSSLAAHVIPVLVAYIWFIIAQSGRGSHGHIGNVLVVGFVILYAVIALMVGGIAGAIIVVWVRRHSAARLPSA